MKMSEVLAFIADPSAFELIYQGHKVKYLNEAGNVTEDSKFFAAGFEFGAHVIVHVEAYHDDCGFEAAYEAWIDSLPEIEKDEYTEAYAPDSDSDSFKAITIAETPAPAWGSPAWAVWSAEVDAKAEAALDAAVDAARDGNGEWPALIEGYREDSSGKVKSLGHYECFHEADLEELEIVRRTAKADEENDAA